MAPGRATLARAVPQSPGRRLRRGRHRALLFGSKARGDWTADSDIDVMVIVEDAAADTGEHREHGGRAGVFGRVLAASPVRADEDRVRVGQGPQFGIRVPRSRRRRGDHALVNAAAWERPCKGAAPTHRRGLRRVAGRLGKRGARAVHGSDHISNRNPDAAAEGWAARGRTGLGAATVEIDSPPQNAATPTGGSDDGNRTGRGEPRRPEYHHEGGNA